MSKKAILGVDPGENIGIALWPNFETGTYTEDKEGFMDFLVGFSAFYRSEGLLIVEDYDSYTQFFNKQDKYVVKLLGICEAIAHHYEVPIKFQKPYSKKHIEEIHGGWKPKNRHEKDAVKHVLLHQYGLC